MLKITNNPIDILLQVFEEEYPAQAKLIKDISIGEIINEQDKPAYASTEFREDGIYITISHVLKNNAKLDFETATELLAHELSHIVAGIKNGHNQKWEECFNKLQELYTNKAINIINSEE